MNYYPSTDLGGEVKSAIASFAQDSSGDPKIVTAGATEDGAEVEGKTIDTDDADSGVLQIPWAAVLADTETFSLAVDIQESDDDSTWETAEELLAAEVQATSDGGTTEYGNKTIDVNLRGRKRYVRFNITPALSAGSTDTAIWASSFVMGGYAEVPQAS